MTKEQAKQRIEYLRKTIIYHRNKYYNDDAPEITDFEFDELMRELEKLESEFSEYDSPESPSKQIRKNFS